MRCRVFLENCTGLVTNRNLRLTFACIATLILKAEAQVRRACTIGFVSAHRIRKVTWTTIELYHSKRYVWDHIIP